VANYTIFYRCSDNAGPYYAYGTNYSGVYYYWGDAHYYRVDHYSDHAEGDFLYDWGLSYYGPACPSGYTIFYRCSDNAGPYYAYGTNYSGVYYYADGHYYRVDHYSDHAEGGFLDEWGLLYYGPTCPGGASFNPAWALYTNSYVGLGHV
jgi:hypothetical protein